MRAAHKLKASLGSFGAQRAYQAALQLEELGGATDVTGCQHAFPELEEAVKRLPEGLADLLRGTGAVDVDARGGGTRSSRPRCMLSIPSYVEPPWRPLTTSSWLVSAFLVTSSGLTGAEAGALRCSLESTRRPIRPAMRIGQPRAHDYVLDRGRQVLVR